MEKINNEMKKKKISSYNIRVRYELIFSYVKILPEILEFPVFFPDLGLNARNDLARLL